MIVPSITNSICDLGPSGCSLTRSGCSFGISVVFLGGSLVCSMAYVDNLLFVDINLELFLILIKFCFEMLFVFPCPLLGLLMDYLVLSSLLFMVLLFLLKFLALYQRGY